MFPAFYFFSINIFSKYKFKKFKLKRNGREIQPQEIILDSLAQRKNFFSQKRFEVPLPPQIFYFFLVFFGLAFSFLWGKSFMLQVAAREEFEETAEKYHKSVYYTLPSRGVIYDQKGTQLVQNTVSFSLVCYKHDLPHQEEEKRKLLEEASLLAGLEYEFLKEKIEEEKKSRVILKEDLSHSEAVNLKTELQEVPAFYIKEDMKRDYRDGATFAHVVGFLGRVTEEEVSSDYSSIDYIGKAGLEKEYENILRGTVGKEVVERDVFGRELSREKMADPVSGNSLVLHLDESLQKKGEEVLKKAIKDARSEAGVFIAMDPETGGVLSLVSVPSYDNNLFSRGVGSREWQEVSENPLNPFWNRVVSAVYPTGSVIKPLIASGVLEEEIIDPRREIGCEGEVTIENPWDEDKPWIFKDWAVHGATSMRKAIAVSCNVYFYHVGAGHGGINGLSWEGIKKYISLFGWGEKTGIDLPGEKSGFIPTPEWKRSHFEKAENKIWVPGDNYNLSIGQGYLSVTPLQVASSFVPIANGGVLYKPHLVKEVVDENKNVVEVYNPEVVRKDFIQEENLRVVREGMKDATTYGSVSTFSDLPFQSAAKTGTAEIGVEKHYHNWITVFAPYENPEIVFTILIEKVPEGERHINPAAKEILRWYFAEEEVTANNEEE